MTTASLPVPAAWYPDPSGRNQYRYWDGVALGADGYPNTEVAGEFARMDSIHKAIGRKPKKDTVMSFASRSTDSRRWSIL